MGPLRLGAAQSAPWGPKPTGSSPAGLSFREGPQLAAACLPSPSKGMQAGGHPVARPLSWAAGSTEPPGGQEVRGDREGVQMSWRPRSTPHMLVLIRDWLLAGVSSPWLPSLGGDLTWIWLRSTAARSIMALARRWNSLPISRDFSKVVLR